MKGMDKATKKELKTKPKKWKKLTEKSIYEKKFL